MPRVHGEPPGALIHGFLAIRGPPPLGDNGLDGHSHTGDQSIFLF